MSHWQHFGLFLKSLMILKVLFTSYSCHSDFSLSISGDHCQVIPIIWNEASTVETSLGGSLWYPQHHHLQSHCGSCDDHCALNTCNIGMGHYCDTCDTLTTTSLSWENKLKLISSVFLSALRLSWLSVIVMAHLLLWRQVPEMFTLCPVSGCKAGQWDDAVCLFLL